MGSGQLSMYCIVLYLDFQNARYGLSNQIYGSFLSRSRKLYLLDVPYYKSMYSCLHSFNRLLLPLGLILSSGMSHTVKCAGVHILL